MANTIKGRDLALEILDGATYKFVGGIRTKSFTRDNPVSDVTNASTPTSSNETEACYNGYSTVTLSGNGVVDTRSSASIYAYKELAIIANSDNPVANFRLSDSLETHTGNFLITSFEKTAEQQGQIEFSISLQNEGVITYS